MRSTKVVGAEESAVPIRPRSYARRRLITRMGAASAVGGVVMALTFLGTSPVAAQRIPGGGGAPPNGQGGPGDGFPGAFGTPGALPTQDGDAPGPSGMGMTALTLVAVGSVNGGTGGDFGANSPGSDSLSSGLVRLGSDSDSGTANVMLRGAQASASYDVQFERFNDHGREDLGQVSTDGSGNYQGNTPNGLGGSHRVGAFVFIRDGHDQFVTEVS